MLTMDVFNDPAHFSFSSMTAAVNRIPYEPGFLGSIGLFEDEPVETTSVWIEELDSDSGVLAFRERQSPFENLTAEKRKARNFEIPSIGLDYTVTAEEIQNVRAYGSATELESLANKIQRGNQRQMRRIELTQEMHKISCIQGKLVDKDGTDRYDYFTEFDRSAPAEINLSSVTEGDLVKGIKSVKRKMKDSMGGLPFGSRIVALCSDNSYDFIHGHADFLRLFKGTPDASRLDQLGVYDETVFQGINWINYRGNTTTNAGLGIADNKIRFFFQGVPGLFQRILGPGETFDSVNTPGQPYYNWLVRDQDNNAFVKSRVVTYPLHICTRPETLFQARTA